MASTFTQHKHIEKPANNDYVNTWDVPVNGNWDTIDTSLGSSTLLNATGLTGNQTLTQTQCRPLSLLVSGAPSGDTTYVVPSGIGGQWVFGNGTTGGRLISIRSAAGGATISVLAGTANLVSCDGSASGMRLSISAPAAAGGSAGQIQYNTGGVVGGDAGLTYDSTSSSLTAINFITTGNTVLGDGAGDTLTLNGNTISIPNILNIGTDALIIDPVNNRIGVNVSAGTMISTITAGGVISCTAGGYQFPDGSVQVTAAPATGSIVAFAGSTPPSGALLCNGQAVSRTLYPRLFAVVGGTYGAGDGSTTFNVPDLRGRVIAMLDGGVGRLTTSTISTPNALNGAGGVQQVQPRVYGNVSGVTAVFSIGGTTSTESSDTGVQPGANAAAQQHTHGWGQSGLQVAISGSITNDGSNVTDLINNVQPTLMLNYIIYT